MAAVVWDSERRRFRTEDGLAYLSYTSKQVVHEEEGKVMVVLDLQHTYVPPGKRGMGIAAQLCQAACVHAKAHGYRIIPTCSYISQTFLPRNSQWKDLLVHSSSSSSYAADGLCYV